MSRELSIPLDGDWCCVLDINRSEIRKLTHLAARRRASQRTLCGYYGFLLTESLWFFGLLDRYGQLVSLSTAQLARMCGFTMLATYLFRVLCRASVIGRLGLRQVQRALSRGRETDAIVITFESGKMQGQGALYLQFLSPIRSVWRGYLAKVRPALIARDLFVGDQHKFFPSNLASCLRSLFKSSPLPSELSLSQIRHQACRHVSELAHAGTSRYSAQMLAQLQLCAGHGKPASCVDKAYLLTIKLRREALLGAFIVEEYMAPAARSLRTALGLPSTDVAVLSAPFLFTYNAGPDHKVTPLPGPVRQFLNPIRGRSRKRGTDSSNARSSGPVSNRRVKKARVTAHEPVRKCLNRSHLGLVGVMWVSGVVVGVDVFVCVRYMVCVYVCVWV